MISIDWPSFLLGMGFVFIIGAALIVGAACLAETVSGPGRARPKRRAPRVPSEPRLVEDAELMGVTGGAVGFKSPELDPRRN